MDMVSALWLQQLHCQGSIRRRMLLMILGVMMYESESRIYNEMIIRGSGEGFRMTLGWIWVLGMVS